LLISFNRSHFAHCSIINFATVSLPACALPEIPISEISIEEIELPLRVTNALKKAGYSTIDALVKAGRLDVSKAKNVGEKSLKVIDSWLKERGFTWK
jgi:DNA-directed RNA polymerase alpha subunit